MLFNVTTTGLRCFGYAKASHGISKHTANDDKVNRSHQWLLMLQ
jgi:hypothetical protein